MLKDYIMLMRPYQWFKSFYIIFGAAPAVFLMPAKPFMIVALLSLGILIMILVQGSIYAINDVFDAELDRKHPEKRERPVASGRIKKHHALFFSFFLFFLACSISWFIDKRVVLINFTLLLLSVTYSIFPRFKDMKFFDIFIPALNFPLRVAVGWYLFEPYNFSRFSFSFEVSSSHIIDSSIQTLLFSSPPRIIEVYTKFSTITLSFISMILFTFFFAVFLTSLKRLGEKATGPDARPVLRKYSKAALKLIALFSSFLVLASYIILSWSLKPALMLLSPILVYFLYWYYDTSQKTKGFSEKPERLMKNVIFWVLLGLALSLGLIILVL